MGAYNGYDAAPQDAFYQNGGYSGPDQYGGSGPPGGFNDNFGSFEDDSGGNYGPGNQGNRGGMKRGGTRRERDDKVHESIIEERIQRERPCRTLFIRNIKYETNSDEVRRQFEEHGEIKTFFDLIANRGMVFVTFYDLRAAERARERLQGSEISGRPIDVHYSLPRDDSGKGGEKNQQELQGTLLVSLRNSVSGQGIDDNEVRRKFQQFGDVKSVRPTGERMDQRYVEYYDTRSAEEAFDRLRHQGLQDGVMDIVLAWEDPPAPAATRRDERDNHGGRGWEDGPRGPPGRGRGRGRGRRGGGGHDDERRPWPRDRDRGRRHEDDYGPGRGGGRGGFSDRFDNRDGGYNALGGGPQGGYGGPAASTSFAPPPPAMPPVDERLDQARKVQQLLAALKQPQGGAPAAPTQPQPPALASGVPPPSAPNPNPYYGAPPVTQQPSLPYQASMPPPDPRGYVPPQPQPQQPAPPPPSSGVNLPPNIMALLQNVQSQQVPSSAPPPQMPPQGQYGMPPPGQGGMMPSMPSMGGPPPPPPGGMQMPPNMNPGDYQQLMSYLQSQAAVKR
ncbi:hypothetical protein DENSPDRAFT_837405 [Dentipellis sp. KUC8613]|nr:hypothetical protein DENSPDRAFT_837405 [Dentipellis sp. KUC8613]